MADGKGRTLWEILTGRNKRDLTPLELQYHNPLGAKVGNVVSLDHEPDLKGINFVIEKMSVYETRVSNRKFYHTDYHLKGITLEMDAPIRFRLRLIADNDANNELGCQIRLMHLYDEMEWDEEFHDKVLGDMTGELLINQDDDGTELEEPKKYWRVEDVLDPYHARETVLSDTDGNGKVEENELVRNNITYWDYHRDTEDNNGVKFTESLTVEMDDKTHYFIFLRGKEVGAYQITVI